MKVAILGLSANPIHLGHVGLAEVVAPHVGEVWFLPCYKHMYGKKLVHPEHRIKMCMAACLGNDRFWASDWEIDHASDGRAIETVEGLRLDFPKYDFHWVIGSDNALGIHNWYKAEELIRTVPFLVVHREGFPLVPGWYDEPPHRVIHTDWSNDISSTAVREMIESGNPDVKNYLPDEVWAYIQRNHLYESDDNGDGCE